MALAPFEWPDVGTDDRFDSYTITLGEWYEEGFYNPSDKDLWGFEAYDDEQYERWCKKFLDRYYFREVGVLPAYRWRLAYLRKLNEIMPKYIPLYARIAEGIDPMQVEDTRYKGRDVFSDFPATLLTGNADYASTASDKEDETVREGDISEQLSKYVRLYNDVDVLVLDECEVLFSSIVNVTLPQF